MIGSSGSSAASRRPLGQPRLQLGIVAVGKAAIFALRIPGHVTPSFPRVVLILGYFITPAKEVSAIGCIAVMCCFETRLPWGL